MTVADTVAHHDEHIEIAVRTQPAEGGGAVPVGTEDTTAEHTADQPYDDFDTVSGLSVVVSAVVSPVMRGSLRVRLPVRIVVPRGSPRSWGGRGGAPR
ncbi:hypothetical protein ACFC09_44810 [Streptomyces sp. NPDC056161]|uniref:hypothetical protein n=1 Tax=Streptomyces sp. NPDC056161 TaxID=3345732 RepID=UPI0035E3ADDB